MASSIKTFTKSGKAMSGARRPQIKPASLGTFDPSTGRVYQRPRLTLNRIQGSSVTVTNPGAAAHVMAQRTASIGGNRAGQQKRHNDAH